MKIFDNNLTLEKHNEISNFIHKLLNETGIVNPPTPVDTLVNAVKLKLIKYSEAYKELFGERIVNENKKPDIYGYINFDKKIIYAHPSQRKFTTFHEITHKILPWHNKYPGFSPHIDNKNTILRKPIKLLDYEANLGASLLQFQIDRFDQELKDLSLSLNSAIKLSTRYSTSLHSTFRRYVEKNNKACALLVYYADFTEEPLFELYYPIQSKSFTEKYGKIDWPSSVSPGESLFDHFYSNKTGEITLKELGINDNCGIDLAYNNYHYFVLIYPKLAKLIKAVKKMRIKRPYKTTSPVISKKAVAKKKSIKTWN
ncbi:MAG: hypothetical protein LHV68_05335 [Elusimicrobia bacterium]|nr:hypothetical protein [Candidatus Liberimonas magnetica]